MENHLPVFYYSIIIKLEIWSVEVWSVEKGIGKIKARKVRQGKVGVRSHTFVIPRLLGRRYE